MNNKYEALSDWLKTYAPVGSWLYFNVSNIESDNTSLNSLSGPRFLNQYIDGTKECELNFAIVLIKNYDTGTSDTNIEAIQECENLINWCENQVQSLVLPDFGENHIVNSVEIMNNVPDLSVDNEQMLAKYQILGKVNYLETRGE